MKLLDKLFVYRNKLVRPYIDRALKVVELSTCFMSVVFLFTLVYEYGFLLSAEETMIVERLYRWSWWAFLADTTLHLMFHTQGVRRRYRGWGRVLCVMLYLTLLPVVFHEPDVPGVVHQVWVFFHSPAYRMVLLVLLSLQQLSLGVVQLLGKRTNPSLIFASSFLLLIGIGSALLLLPRATYQGISFIDALFTATSAVCVTGLTTVDISSVFTFEGQFIILLLIQVGGLGVMTLTSFFAMFFMGNTSLYNQLAVRDMVSSQSLSSLLSTLLYILGFTLAIEAMGTGLIFWSIHDTLGMSVHQELAFSVFHAVSAFCNAGFSTLAGNLGNEQVLYTHQMLYLVLSLLVILGGIGFPILVNFYETLVYEGNRLYHRFFRKGKRFRRQIHLYNLNTRIVVIMTAILLLVGTLLILVLEWNHAFVGMSVSGKWVHAFFNATCPRTAGFCSVGMTTFTTQTLLLMVVLMMIGGGTQSTAGGVKVNVFAVVLLNLRAILVGARKVNIFNRELSQDSIRRSNATLILYLLVVFTGIFVLSLLEPEASMMALVFECTSALSTVGASLDLTPTLSLAGKGVIIVLMFIGRVGLLTLMCSLIRQQRVTQINYPSDNIIIN